MRPRARLIRLAMLLSAVALAAGALGACGSAATGELIPGTGPLVSVQMRGGMCADGGMCDSSVILDRDGRVRSSAKPPNDLGVVSAANMSTLTAAIAATDFATLRSKPFTGECPIAFDGQELIFEFAAIGGTQRLASCEVDIDWGHPLFIAVAAALGEWIPLPLT
ncbi:MAG TPA: hypothetical protein VFP56_00860 [Candidatus Limnocylindrales bacterium]|nr:hypothetical protein [Candidatus Limnocylindrales bacterium]